MRPFTLQRSCFYILFCLGQPLEVGFSPVYGRTLTPGKAFIIYDPDRDLACNFKMVPGGRLFILSMSLDSLHRMFAPESDRAPVFRPENAQHRFYEERAIHPEVQRIFHQWQEVRMNEASQRLYEQAKSLEILSLFFSQEKPDADMCPFLNNEELVSKLKRAKNLLLQNFSKPDTLPVIARQVGLNELQLKKGFKEVYGNTPYQFVLEYKLDQARQLLIQQRLPVSEVAERVGYSNVSHFIDAFRRRYGVTPKKYNV